MTKAEIYEALNRVADLDAELKIIGIKIERLETSVQGRAIRYDAVNVQTSPGDPVGQIAGDLSELLDKRRSLLEQMAGALSFASAMIDLVPDKTQRLVLYYHYIALESWADVAERVRFTERHVFRLRDEALGHIFKNFSKCQ